MSFAAFAALAFFGGTIYNRVGIRASLVGGGKWYWYLFSLFIADGFIPGFGYACLASAYFTTAHIGNRATPWVVLAGCIEGLSGL